jgi:cytochrome c biogenesis protein CcmG/thiol:disulfide interchange protein DsbE
VTRIPRTVLAIVSLTALVFVLGAAREPMIGKAAPDFQVTTLDGKKLTLADYKNQVLVINFWATWCGPCKRELPLLDKYYRAQEHVGLRVLAVTTEDSVPVSQLKSLAAALTIPMVRRFKGDYGPLKGVPTNYVIGRDGILRYAKAGSFTLDDLNEILVPLLREPAPGAQPDKAEAGN